MKRTAALTAGALALTLTGAGLLAAQSFGSAPGGHGPDEMGRLHRAARFLQLTEEQQQLLRGIVEDGKPERERLRDAMRAAHERFQEALEAPNPDPASVGEAAIAMHALREQVRTSRESFEAAFEGLLTPEQQQKWELLQAVRAAGGGPGGGPGGEPGAGPRGPRGRR